MHITLTGNLGSGKSTICKILKEKYGYEIYSTGTVQRKIAEEMGLTVLEMNKLMCSDHKYDHLIDDTTARISRENQDKNIVFDSRLAWNFVESSFKVFLSVSLDEAARRVYADTSRGKVETYKDFLDCKEQLKKRAETEDKRYEEIYGIHYFDFSNYNLVLDSSYTTPEILAQNIAGLAGQSDINPDIRKILLSPKRLGIDTEEKTTRTDCYQGGTAVITKAGDEFEVIEGIDIVKKAAEYGHPFVKCELR
jgi:cytidylate kinase